MTTRLDEILDQINKNGTVEVLDLAQQFDVTEQTVRRDLATLCQRGLATRMHGGARRLTTNVSQNYDARRMNNIGAKSEIAAAAAALIPNGASVMLNIGTTTEQVASSLTKHKNLSVITNNTNILQIFRETKLKSLVQVGGMVRQSDGAVIGEEAVEHISRYKADFAVIGASAIDDDGDVLDFDAREVAVARAILKNARTKILVIDSAKFEVGAPVRITSIADLDFVVTNARPSNAFHKLAVASGTQLVVTSSSDDK